MVSAPRLLLCFLVLFPFLSNISLSARSGGSRGAPPRHDASLLLHPTSISLSHSQSISPLPPHNLTLQPSHLCATCHLVIHEFLRFIISSFDQEQFDGVLEASALASLFCEGQPFSHMQPTYTAACQELILELGRGKPDPTDPSVNVTLEELFAPLIGERTVRHYVEFPQRDFILSTPARTHSHTSLAPLAAPLLTWFLLRLVLSLPCPYAPPLLFSSPPLPLCCVVLSAQLQAQGLPARG